VPDLSALACDFMAFSGHKMYGPMGTGALVGRRSALERLVPLRLGGDMVEWVSATDAGWAALPARLEGGTPNVSGAVGLAAAARFIDSIGRAAIDRHVDALRAQAVAGLAALDGVTVLSPEAAPSAIVSFVADGVHPHDIGTLLDERGIAVRTGHHCAQPLLDHLGLGRPRAPRSRSTTRTPRSTAWWPVWRMRWRCCDERRPPCRPRLLTGAENELYQDVVLEHKRAPRHFGT
jgi:cysteine desulfurase/selenocysteine lyase